MSPFAIAPLPSHLQSDYGKRYLGGEKLHLTLVIRGESVPGHSADNEYPCIIGTPKD